MNTKKLSCLMLLIASVLFISCGKTVTDRYGVRLYIPTNANSKPKVNISQLYYKSDSTAIAEETAQFMKWKEGLRNEYNKILDEYFKTTNPTELSKLEFKGKTAAIEELMDERLILLFITHDSSVTPEEVLEFVKKCGFDIKKLQEYGEEHDFSLKMVEI